MPPDLRLRILSVPALVVVACTLTQPPAVLPEPSANSVAPASTTSAAATVNSITPTCTALAPTTDVPLPANWVIAPETLGQLRLRWNVNFPGEWNMLRK